MGNGTVLEGHLASGHPVGTKIPFQGVGIIRDKDGNPKFDDPHNVPQIILDALTPKDLEHLNKLRNL